MSRTAQAANDNETRLMTKKAAAAYLGVSTPTFAKWVMSGVLPPAVGSTKMWDRKALDLHIDKLSGLTPLEPARDDSFAAWKARNEAKKSFSRTG